MTQAELHSGNGFDSDVGPFLGEQLTRAALSIFERRYGARPVEGKRAPCAPWPYVVSTIGFTGDRLRGALTLVVRESEASGLLPSDGSIPISLPNCCDAVGEATNLVLGRLKLYLLTYRVTISLATPVTALGSPRAVAPAPDAISLWQSFSSSMGRFSLRLDAIADRELDFDPPPDELRAPDSGELCLF